MKATPGDSRLGSNHLTNFERSILIKQEMLRVHDELKAEGIYPTLKKILRAIPFHVNESFASELRRDLVEDGLIPPPPRGCTKNAQVSAEHRIVHWASPEEIAQRKQEINQEFFAQMKGEGEMGYQPTPDQMTPKQASEWARTRYNAAWKAIQGISRSRRCWAFLAHPETVEVG